MNANERKCKNINKLFFAFICVHLWINIVFKCFAFVV